MAKVGEEGKWQNWLRHNAVAIQNKRLDIDQCAAQASTIFGVK